MGIEPTVAVSSPAADGSDAVPKPPVAPQGTLPVNVPPIRFELESSLWSTPPSGEAERFENVRSVRVGLLSLRVFIPPPPAWQAGLIVHGP